jgi:septal ring factor EnvC (AmiA/AmiB activator)
MYRLIDNYADLHLGAGNLVVVRDGNNRLFGVYLNESIQKREGTYYGSGESYATSSQPRRLLTTQVYVQSHSSIHRDDRIQMDRS